MYFFLEQKKNLFLFVIYLLHQDLCQQDNIFHFHLAFHSLAEKKLLKPLESSHVSLGHFTIVANFLLQKGYLI